MPGAFGWFGHRRPFTPSIYVYLVAVLHVDARGRLVAAEALAVEEEAEVPLASVLLPLASLPSRTWLLRTPCSQAATRLLAVHREVSERCYIV